jgi:hypothetical protein
MIFTDARNHPAEKPVVYVFPSGSADPRFKFTALIGIHWDVSGETAERAVESLIVWAHQSHGWSEDLKDYEIKSITAEEARRLSGRS